MAFMAGSDFCGPYQNRVFADACVGRLPNSRLASALLTVNIKIFLLSVMIYPSFVDISLVFIVS